MKKLVLASTAAIAMLGLAACSDTDETTTQSVDPAVEDPAAPVDDGAAMTEEPVEEEPVESEPIAPEDPAANQ